MAQKSLICQNYDVTHEKWFLNVITPPLCRFKKTWFSEKIEDNYRTKVQDFTRWVHWKDRRVRRSWKGVPHWLGTSGARFTHSPSPHHHCSLGYKQPLWFFSLSFHFRWMQAVFCIWGPCGFTLFWFFYHLFCRKPYFVCSIVDYIIYKSLDLTKNISLKNAKTVLFLYL